MEALSAFETQRVFARYCVADYLHGRCHLFAVAASHALGLDLLLVIDPEPVDDDLDSLPFPVLCHAVCRLPDDTQTVIDAGGCRLLQHVIDEYCTNEYEILEGPDAWAFLENWLPVEFETGEEAALKAHAATLNISPLDSAHD